MLISALNIQTLIWRSMERLDYGALTGHLRYGNFEHFGVGLIFHPQRLLLYHEHACEY